MNTAIECKNLTKAYGAELVLEEVSLSVKCGEACVLIGPSGSGKTTLLSILGCLLTPTNGELLVAGKRVDFQSPRTMSNLRRLNLGFVFQHAQLLPFLSVTDNLSIAGNNAGMPAVQLRTRIEALLERLGLTAMAMKKPAQLSGGQRQRVAIARALLHQPAILLADEPTAALDWQNGEVVADLLVAQAREARAALIVVTHDTRLLPKFDRVFSIENGRLQEHLPNHPNAEKH